MTAAMRTPLYMRATTRRPVKRSRAITKAMIPPSLAPAAAMAALVHLFRSEQRTWYALMRCVQVVIGGKAPRFRVLLVHWWNVVSVVA